jgi:hypothetical protein
VPPEPEQARHPVAERDRQGHLHQRPDQGYPLYGRERAQGEVQPDGEEQERHPDLGEQLYVVGGADRGAARVRPDDHAGEDVAEDERQPEAARDDPAHEGGDHDERDVPGYAHALSIPDEDRFV